MHCIEGVIRYLAMIVDRFASLRSACLRKARFSALVYAMTLSCAMPAWRHEAGAQTADNIKAETITLGLVSEINRSAIADHFGDFIRYVARRLSSGPEIDGRVVVAATPLELVKLLEEKRVDFFFESVYPTYTINYVHGAGKTLLRRWKGGMAEYQSLIFTKNDGGIRRLEDLRGKTIAFEDPGSTSGYLLPKLFLQRSGFKLVETQKFNAQAAPAEIAYVFAHSLPRLLELVLTKQAGAGAFSDDDHGALSNARKAEVAVLAQTERLPRHLVSVRADLPPRVARRLEEVLRAMPDDAEGRPILKRTDQTTKFDPVPGGEEGLRRRLLETFYSRDKK